MPLTSDREKGAHLLRRFGLGASEAELNFYLRNGYNSAVDRLVDYETIDEAFDVDVTSMPQGVKQVVRMPSVVNWWVLRMLMTRRPLQEKMTLFWHDHFATSASKVKIPMLMLAQNQILRRNAVGNFRQLISETSKDPAMLIWLDNQENFAGHANENFAREVMELFTLGIGHYTEKDVQEGARAFTGWSYERVGAKERAANPNMQGGPKFSFKKYKHDAGNKTFLGSSGLFDGDDILNILCDQPRTAEYITWKIWSWFVYPDPEVATVKKFADVFMAHNLEIKPLLKAIMRSPEFVSDRATRSVFKNPVDICVTTMRQLGVGELVGETVRRAGKNVTRGELLPAFVATDAMKKMGMYLMYPPDVSGWDGGAAWISSATLLQRISWVDKLFGKGKGRRSPYELSTYNLFGADPTSAGVVRALLSVMNVTLKADKIASLTLAADKACGGQVTEANADETAGAVCRLLFTTAEFQFA